MAARNLFLIHNIGQPCLQTEPSTTFQVASVSHANYIINLLFPTLILTTVNTTNADTACCNIPMNWLLYADQSLYRNCMIHLLPSCTCFRASNNTLHQLWWKFATIPWQQCNVNRQHTLRFNGHFSRWTWVSGLPS